MRHDDCQYCSSHLLEDAVVKVIADGDKQMQRGILAGW
jgi:hypothetical protein